MSLDLFGQEVDESVKVAHYREVSCRDTTTLGCTDCIHLGTVKSAPLQGRPMVSWICKLTKAEVDPDFGTCGNFSQREGV